MTWLDYILAKMSKSHEETVKIYSLKPVLFVVVVVVANKPIKLNHETKRVDSTFIVSSRCFAWTSEWSLKLVVSSGFMINFYLHVVNFILANPSWKATLMQTYCLFSNHSDSVGQSNERISMLRMRCVCVCMLFFVNFSSLSTKRNGIDWIRFCLSECACECMHVHRYQ